MSDPLMEWIDQEVENMGFEVVETERAGSRARPILRLRIDKQDTGPRSGVTVDDCAKVSRALESALDERADLSERYVLEVSSPGVERPLVRKRDFERFAGEEIALVGKSVLDGKSTRVVGELVRLDDSGGREEVIVKTKDGELAVPREDTKRIHLVYRWGKDRG